MQSMPLSDLKPGKHAYVLENGCSHQLQKRLEDMGLLPGAEIVCLHKSPSGSPVAYDIQGASIALRRRDTREIRVEELL